ncbi:MopE-related protein [Pyxidicoccus fallax]|uniref:BNR repeat domain protein n=1 Tax=Pyxidicoccus fallax TaxID=394095 RepID=A0A848L6J2_9BACT|nr:hypothetical protein [Pyxidicoccus fallax]
MPQSVATGAYHSLFLKKDGEVWAWGQNVVGQLGTGSSSSTPQPHPSKVNGLPPIKAIAAGIAHSVALDVSGDVWVWGQNANGQAGLGSAGGLVLVPTKVAALSGIQAIAANGNYSLALDASGRLWAWGQNTSGQMGTSTTSTSVPMPGMVPGLPSLRSMVAGVNHVLALDEEGRVWGWGLNTSGQVGTGSTSAAVLAPVRVESLPLAKAVAAGAGHSLIIDEQFGNVWSWGQNTFGQVGKGIASTTPVLSPTPVEGVFAATAIAAGHNSSLVIMGGGFVKAWGHNVSGQLGNGTTMNSASAVNVTELADALAIAAGAQHALALRPGCPVWGWGHNGQGQLGTGATSTSPTTAPVSTQIVNTFYFDGDMDGFGDEYLTEQGCEPSPGFVEELDCDDYTPSTYPGAPELCNGTDDSCDEVVDEGNPSGGENCATGKPGVCAEGTTACVEGSVACQQNEAASAEQCDSLDNDCDGEADEGNPGGLQACETGQQGVCGEGVTYCTHGALECAPVRGPSAEVCDSLDNDCNGQADDGLAFLDWYRDGDGDNYGLTSQSVQSCTQPSGHAPTAGDCNDANASIHPGAPEVCDGVDNDCDTQADEGLPTSTWYRDADGDGFGNAGQAVQNCRQPAGYVSNTSDCNDADASIHPGAAEVCDGVDNDCDTQVDEGVSLSFFRDDDSDTYGTGPATAACTAPSGYVQRPGDCNDGNASINPGAAEMCDGVDNDCDTQADEGLPTLTWYRDADGDTYGTSASPLQKCSQPAGYVQRAGDCNDGNASIHPGAAEVCDGVDNDCDSQVDEGVQFTFYRDADSDTYGTGPATAACTQPSGYAQRPGDCNDGNASIHPGVTEVCDGVDNDCDAQADEGLPTSTWYRDADGDTYGTSTSPQQKCSQPAGYVSNANDCNDANASIHPGATEVCNAVDDDCDAQMDEGVKLTFYRDADSDNYGSRQTTTACTAPAGYVSNASDCNDANASTYPGAMEVCNDVDDDCDAQVDEGLPTSRWYRDADSDTYGSLASGAQQKCSQPAGYVSNNSDCNDGNSSIRPGATEVCNDVDDDCDFQVDDGLPRSTWYRDADGDTFGTSSTSNQFKCYQPAGYVSNKGDCNDANASINPGATEVSDAVDNDCDAQVDEYCGMWSVTGRLSTPREAHVMSLLPSGKVLVAGGRNDSYADLATAEVYDPGTGVWSPTGTMATGRIQATATLLPSGKVLVTGGSRLVVNGPYVTQRTAEVYNPSTGTWSSTGSMAVPRSDHTATLLPSGKVLVVGGGNTAFVASAELYDPATGTWSPAGTMAAARSLHTATLLPSGKVLVVGGVTTGGTNDTSELYDPGTGTWAFAGLPSSKRYHHTATLLPSGKVLIQGGPYSDEENLLYDPGTGTWTSVGHNTTGATEQTATLLPSGTVLVAGGSSAGVRLFDPGTRTWAHTFSLSSRRGRHTATLLPSGKVLVVGGYGSSSNGTLDTAELYTP